MNKIILITMMALMFVIASAIGFAPPDADGDGVPNNTDNCDFDVNPGQEDFDGDGVGDVCDTDVDGDGVLDNPGPDNCLFLNSADQSDPDTDGFGTPCDNCPAVNNPGQEDNFGTTLGDACEDTDSDTVLDIDDFCPLVTNATNADADGDGTAGVGLGDVCDNCVNDVNPSQSDADNDGLGDACDNDSDNDGILDLVDNCPVNANVGQADSDGDGIGDACDVCAAFDNTINDVQGTTATLDITPNVELLYTSPLGNGNFVANVTQVNITDIQLDIGPFVTGFFTGPYFNYSTTTTSSFADCGSATYEDVLTTLSSVTVSFGEGICIQGGSEIILLRYVDFS